MKDRKAFYFTDSPGEILLNDLVFGGILNTLIQKINPKSNTKGKITSKDAVIYTTIMYLCEDDINRITRPVSQKQIGETMHIEAPNINTSIKKLEKANLIEIIKEDGKANRYRFKDIPKTVKYRG